MKAVHRRTCLHKTDKAHESPLTSDNYTPGYRPASSYGYRYHVPENIPTITVPKYHFVYVRDNLRCVQIRIIVVGTQSVNPLPAESFLLAGKVKAE